MCLEVLNQEDMEKKFAIVRLLLEKGADPNQPEQHWWSPLHSAVALWQHSRLHVFEKKDAYYSLISMLLEHADMGAKKSAGYSDNALTERSALAVCLQIGDDTETSNRSVAELIDLFLAHGMDINEPQDKHGNTLLHLAVCDGHNYSFLLKRGAQLSSLNNDGKTPLMMDPDYYNWGPLEHPKTYTGTSEIPGWSLDGWSLDCERQLSGDCLCFEGAFMRMLAEDGILYE
jgi:hypothetical protein